MNVYTVLSSSSLDVLQDHFLVLKEYIRAPRAWYLQKAQHSSLVLQQAIKDLRSSPLLPLPNAFPLSQLLRSGSLDIHSS